ncbi:MAG: outer membrane protein assembly factor, partial [Acidobacteria bacterium]|nr:outer membrane protein assembly factor [Acidobacteriota bacterium]
EYNTSGPMVGTDFFTNRFLYDPRTGPVTEEKKKAAHPKEILNRYGGTLTGPLRIPRIYNGHDRTFFSYGFQGFKRRSTNAAQYNMPAAQQRAGDFSALLAVGSQYQIYDPATVTPAAGGRFHRDPFPGNRVPASRFDPMAVRLMDYWVMPNAPGTADGRQNYASSNFFGVNYWSHVGRVDHVFSDSNRFFARVLKDELMRRDEWYPNIARGTNRTGLNEGLTLDDVHVFSPSFLMNAKFSVSRVDETAGRRTSGMDITTLGFPASLAGQIDRRGATFPEISVDGLFGLGEAGGNRFIVNYYTWSASFTKSRGNHSLRFGGEYRILQENGIEWGNVSPAIDFGTTWTRGPLDNAPESPSGIGQGFASFLLGLPTGGAIHYRPFYAEQSSFMGVYIQDDWKLTRRLTVNFGLRYEREGPTTERFDRSVRQFDFITPNPLEPAARAAYARSPIPEVPAAQFRTTGGLTFAGAGGNPRGLWATDDNNFAPRIGFAWAAAPATVVRGGYGIFFESMGINRISVNSTGFSITNQLVPSLDNGRTFRATLRNPFPDPLTPPPGASGGLLTNVGQGVSFFDSKPSSPYMQRWSVGMQRELPFRVLAEATYVGTRGTKFRIGRDHNPVPRQWLTTSPLRDNATVNFLSAQVANPFFGLMPSGAGLTGRNVARSQLLRAYPHFTGISAQYAAGSSWYHSLQFRLEKRLSKGFSLSGNYTWSKSMQAMSYLNPTDDRPEHVISSLDRPQRLVVNGIYELPFGPGKRFAHVRGPLRHFVEGWQASAIYTAQSGPPIAFGNIAFFGDLHDIPLPRSERSPNRWFNTQAGFNRNSREQPSNNVRTLSSRFTGLRADGRNFWALAAMKNFVLREGVKLQLRAEAQNALNHPHFAAPNVVPTNVLFGTVSATDGEPRLMFAGLKL